MRYVAERAARFRPPSATELARLSITSEEIRLHLKLELRRPGRCCDLGELIREEAWQLCTSFAGPDSDGWSFEVNLERARRYKDIYTVIDFLEISYPNDAQTPDPAPASPSSLDPTQTAPATDNKKVMVVYGRDKARHDLFNLLRALGLEPIEWAEAIKATGTATPYTGQAVDAAFETAHVAILLLVPEEEVRLRDDLQNPHDPQDTQIAWQPRPNVLYEGGIAITSHPDRTIILELGRPRPATDLAGLNTIRISSDPSWRQELANRLSNAGCPVNTNGTDWLTVGEFAIPNLDMPAAHDASPERKPEPPETRLDRLRNQYKRGRAIKTAPPWQTGPAPASLTESQEGYERQRDTVAKWAEATWRMLRDDFPPEERLFCPRDPTAAPAFVWMIIQDELQASGGADSYLDNKLEFLSTLLRAHERQTA